MQDLTPCTICEEEVEEKELMHGLLLVDKPPGPTSHDIVERVRRSHRVKAGHSGTLDPFAQGLLVLLIGRATREQAALTAMPKEYDAIARFGIRSTSGDPEGELTVTNKQITKDQLEEILPDFRGDIDQRVPALSAVKVEGERLYRRTRRGQQVEGPVRRVRIDHLELRTFNGQRAQLRVTCSKGTYIRQLVTDIGERSGAGAYCEQLTRTAVGPLALKSADSIEAIEQAANLDGLKGWLPMSIHFGNQLDLEI